MNWGNHEFNISNKFSNIVGLLNNLKHYLPSHIKLLLYKTLILPHIKYCILVWGHKSDRLFKIQKRPVGTINASNYNAHTEPLYKKCRLLKLNDIQQIQELKFDYKFKNHQIPKYLQQLPFILNNTFHEHNTRRRNAMHIIRTTHEFAKHCIRNSTPKLVNSSPPSITTKIQTYNARSHAVCKKLLHQ